MSIIEAIILGFVQGAAEFLPISSSGHLVLTQAIFGITENNLAFDVLLHLATLFAVIAAYHETVFGLIREFFLMIADIFRGRGARIRDITYRKYIFCIVVGCIPAGIVGVLFDDLFESMFSNVTMVCVMLIVTGFVLLAAERIGMKNTKGIDSLTLPKSFVTGLFQMCAIMPGLTRSGTTMLGGLCVGLKKEDALEFSFMLSLPTILGSVVLKIGDIADAIREISIVPVLVGFVTALVVGYLSIQLFRKVVRDGSLMGFAAYCWLLATVVILNLDKVIK
ncbi:MAG: undecaprenyl-diphosphate phosphatase [Eubacteriaceae bacterium]|nr:undecaprenyl-diphosphate phosphatase [Eubacteriaceae bacterium]